MKALSISLVCHMLVIALLLLCLQTIYHNDQYRILAHKSIWASLVKYDEHQPQKKLTKKGLQIVKKKVVHHREIKHKNRKPVIGQEAVKGKVLDRLVALLYQQINAHYQLSSQAIEMQEIGTSMVSFVLLPSGYVKQVKLKKSSGFPLLDQAAIQAVKKSTPFSLKGYQLHTLQKFEIPINFQSK
jgi:TonB family protein